VLARDAQHRVPLDPITAAAAATDAAFISVTHFNKGAGGNGAAGITAMSRVMGEYWRILAFPSFLGGDFAYAARIPTIHAPSGFASNAAVQFVACPPWEWEPVTTWNVAARRPM